MADSRRTKRPVIVKKSSPKNLSVDCRPTHYRQFTNRLPTGYRHLTDTLPTVARLSVGCRPTVGRQVAYISGKICWPSVGRLSANSRPTVGRHTADSRPTVGRLSVDRRPTVDRQSTDRFFGEVFFTITKRPMQQTTMMGFLKNKKAAEDEVLKESVVESKSHWSIPAWIVSCQAHLQHFHFPTMYTFVNILYSVNKELNWIELNQFKQKH